MGLQFWSRLGPLGGSPPPHFCNPVWQLPLVSPRETCPWVSVHVSGTGPDVRAAGLRVLSLSSLEVSLTTPSAAPPTGSLQGRATGHHLLAASRSAPPHLCACGRLVASGRLTDPGYSGGCDAGACPGAPCLRRCRMTERPEGSQQEGRRERPVGRGLAGQGRAASGEGSLGWGGRGRWPRALSAVLARPVRWMTAAYLI